MTNNSNNFSNAGKGHQIIPATTAQTTPSSPPSTTPPNGDSANAQRSAWPPSRPASRYFSAACAGAASITLP
jgi:hypothetical protein